MSIFSTHSSAEHVPHSMGCDLPNTPEMQSSQPRFRHELPQFLTPDHEKQEENIVEEQDTSEGTGDDDSITAFQHPCQDLQPETETDGLFTNIHGNEHLRRVSVVGIYRICKRKREVEVRGPIIHSSTHKETNPMQAPFRGETVQHNPSRPNQHCRQHDA